MKMKTNSPTVLNCTPATEQNTPPFLLALLATKRPSGGAGMLAARAYIQNIIFNTMINVTTTVDDYGNLHAILGDSKILFSCHLDTVHHEEGTNEVYLDNGTLHTNGTDVLGADDASGAYIMYELLRAGVAGHYIFHLDEEVGGLGSSWVAAHQSDMLEKYTHAIAFDRKGYTDIATEQCGAPCASSEFANQLGTMIFIGSNEEIGLYGEDCVYTDTAEYTHIIPECTNISVGYFNEHTTCETQDLTWLLKLVDTLIGINWESLTAVRDPSIDVLGDYDDYGFQDYPSCDELDRMSDIIYSKTDATALLLQGLGYDSYELKEVLKELEKSFSTY